ncbi:MAG: methyltransferase domain-containing protein [Brachymonas sp.]|nr:methyltransferase domain-containing protein [Brachymonas sp.]
MPADTSKTKAHDGSLWDTVNRAVSASPQSLFLKELLAKPGAVGAVCASSPWLAARMAAWVDLAQPGLVVELGGGTGVITSALLEHGVAPERLVVIEQSESLAEHLHKHFAGVHVIHGDAADLAEMQASGRLCRHGSNASATVGTIVSGLPLLSIPSDTCKKILQAACKVLAPQGRLLQFTYALHGPSPWQSTGLVVQHSERVLANLPPARIDVLAHG